MSRAQCEFNQYLESLDGFPTVATARTPASGPVDLPTATVPANVAVIDGVTKQSITQVAVSYDATARYLVICAQPQLAGGRVHLDGRARLRHGHPGPGQAGGGVDGVQPAQAGRFADLRRRHRGDAFPTPAPTWSCWPSR